MSQKVCLSTLQVHSRVVLKHKYQSASPHPCTEHMLILPFLATITLHSPSSCGTSWNSTASVVPIAREMLCDIAAPIARPSAKLCTLSPTMTSQATGLIRRQERSHILGRWLFAPSSSSSVLLSSPFFSAAFYRDELII